MTYIDPDFAADFGDLDPIEAELDAVGEALAEVEAEEAAGLLAGYPGAGAPAAEKMAYYEARSAADDDEWATAAGGDYGDEDDPGGDDPEGPWHDGLGQLGAAGAALDARRDLEGIRIGEDIVAQLDRRPSSEAILARAMPRIEAGTYTQDSYWRGDEAAAAAAARDPLGRYQAACGPLDDFARCSARFHTPDCHTSIESAAARGSAEEATAWADTLQGRANPPGTDAGALGLANEPQPGDGVDVWADLLETGEPGSADPQLHDRVMNLLGEADAAPRERDPGLPDTTVIRAILGI